MTFIMVGIGGMLGSVTRYSISSLINRYSKPGFPFATFGINILGALLLGMVCARQTSTQWYMLAGEGFLGAFTTFSTFMYEGVELIKSSRYWSAAAYICATFLLGIAGFCLGYYLL